MQFNNRGRALLGCVLEELKDMMPVEAWETLRYVGHNHVIP